MPLGDAVKISPARSANLNSIVSLTGLSSTMAPSLSFAMFMSLPFIRLKYEITIDDHAHREPRPDRQIRLNVEIAQSQLNVEIALNDFLPGLVQTIACPEPERLNENPVVAGTAIGAGAEFTTNPKQRGQQCSLEQRTPVVVVILEAGITCGVGTRLALQHDRAAVWHDQAAPNQQHARLSERNLAVINTYESRPLRPEYRRCVVALRGIAAGP
jgi:hypothetical protein